MGLGVGVAVETGTLTVRDAKGSGVGVAVGNVSCGRVSIAVEESRGSKADVTGGNVEDGIGSARSDDGGLDAKPPDTESAPSKIPPAANTDTAMIHLPRVISLPLYR